MNKSEAAAALGKSGCAALKMNKGGKKGVSEHMRELALKKHAHREFLNTLFFLMRLEIECGRKRLEG